ncbi:hypothetical protein CANCADRAFT_109297 [Tortispora caseinolytica NRRL Y-17796]|uniref:FACT complex subunit n=1 Tax=Tortispora caseinolytica NRRL Y-17796 TaxID=767744 RepID=A0A1E4TG07_9ASCO|nr:hypothetical protein CANCADRAFT_109297 [Tortispora caseinolytica NRRL Y-17796]
MSEVNIDRELFQSRISRIYDLIASDSLDGAQSILVVIGKSDEERPYQKGTILFNWLLTYEFSSTLMLITKDSTYFVTSPSKAKYLDAIKSDSVQVIPRPKDPAEAAEAFRKVLPALGSKVGHFPKDQFQGPFVDAWNDILESLETAPEYVDVSAPIASVLRHKTEEEIKTIRTASKASVAVMTSYLSDKIFTAIDEGKRISHSDLSIQVQDLLDDQKFMSSKALTNISSDFDSGLLDWCYTPIIMSGGSYNLRPSAASDDSALHHGVVIAELGLRYKSYCSNLGRTFMVDPTKSQETYYSFLLKLQKKALESIKDGVTVSSVYEACMAMIKSTHPELESKFLKSIGWSTGIDFRDGSFLLSPKNNQKFFDGMTLCLFMGFSDLTNEETSDAKAKKYSLLIVDTIRVTKDEPIVFTDAPKSLNDIAYYFEQNEKPKNTKQQDTRRNTSSAVLKSKLRAETKSTDETAEARRREMQTVLREKLQLAGLERFPDETDGADVERAPVFKKYEAFKRDTQLPASVKDLRVVVDFKAQSIIIPIAGRPVPYHINAIRNVSKNDEGDYTMLRINFNTPGQVIVKKDDLPYEDPQAQFLRSISLRSKDHSRFADIARSIQDMKKEATKRDNQKKEMEDVIKQAKLLEVRNQRPLRLDSVFVRPHPDNKRISGYVEIHENGLRYQSQGRSDQKIDVLFSNIQHLFFQPCDHELIALIHARLKTPIIVGKRKTFDVQFFREASDVQYDETGNRRRKYRYGDEDELEAEQEDRRRRAALNKEFKAFAEKITDAANGMFDVDIPFRDLGFNGVPFRANVLCQPTTECLVQLIDAPFLVVTLKDIEVVHLERVQFGLKNFDMVIVYKDYSKPVTHINSIPMEQLDQVQDWLNEVEIAFYSGPLNLNWNQIMKTVQSDPHDFFENGGWSFLSTESDDEDDDESESASDFQASDDEVSDEEESDYSEAEASDFGDESGSEVEEEESGDDWDELERKAVKEEQRRDR